MPVNLISFNYVTIITVLYYIYEFLIMSDLYVVTVSLQQ